MMASRDRKADVVKTRCRQGASALALLLGFAALIVPGSLRALKAADEDEEKLVRARAAAQTAARLAAAGLPTEPGEFPTAEKRTGELPTTFKLPLTVHIGLYADPRVPPCEGVGGGPRHDGCRDAGNGGPIPDFCWTVAVNNKETFKYLTESGFTMTVVDTGKAPRTWRASVAAPNNAFVDLPIGHWYTLETVFHDAGANGRLCATHRIYGPGRNLLYEVTHSGLFGNPLATQAGNLAYSSITNVDERLDRIFVWAEPRHHFNVEKVELINVAELTSDPAASSPARWEAMRVAAAAMAKAYHLKSDEPLRRIGPPYPADRDEVVRVLFPEGSAQGRLYFVSRENRLAPNIDGPGAGLVLEPTLRDVITLAVGDAGAVVKGDAKLIKRRIGGDFVVRAGSDPDAALDQLARILAADAGLNVTFSQVRQGATSYVLVTPGD